MIRTENVKIDHHGRTVHGTLYLPCGMGKFPAVIFSHGYNGCGDDFDAAARLHAEAGVAAFTYTFCGGSTRDKSGFSTESMTLFTECEDLSAVVDFMRAHKSVDEGKIVLFGGSQGGLVSVMTAAGRADDIAAMCLLYPALCIPDNWRDRFSDVESIPESVDFWGMTLGRNFFVSLRDIDVTACVDGFSKSVLIMHGTDDMIVPLSYSRDAAGRFKNARLEIFPNEGHGFSPAGDEKMARMTLNFVRDVTKTTPVDS